MIKYKKINGSFTVEAALIMTILLPTVITLIYAAFYLHDRTVLQGAACEVAAMGSNLSEEDDRASKLNQLKDQLITSRLLGSKNIECSLSAGNDAISVSYTGSFPIPGMVLRLFGTGALPFDQTWRRELFHPADTIRKIRGLEYMIETIKE